MNQHKFKTYSAYWFTAWLCTAVMYLAFSMHMPVSINSIASHDDTLFIRNALQLVQGNWLGSYNQMTLAKGAGFSLFLAANAALGIPITLSMALLYLFACLVFSRTLADIGLRKGYAFAIFLTLLFQPAVIPTRIIRDNIYPSLTLLVIAGIIFVVQQKPLRLILKETVLFGFAFGIFWITREEGVWVLPGICCYIIYKGVMARKDLRALKHLCLRLFVYFTAATVVPILVAFLNLLAYGKFETVDFTNRSFSTALSVFKWFETEGLIS